MSTSVVVRVSWLVVQICVCGRDGSSSSFVGNVGVVLVGSGANFPNGYVFRRVFEVV